MDAFKERANIIGERLRDGREAALNELIEYFKKKIYNLSYRYTWDAEEAYDLSQEIFLRAYSKIHLYKKGTDFHAWFIRLAVNRAINYRSKIDRNPSHLAYDLIEKDMERGSENDPVSTIQEEDNVRRIGEMLRKLAKKERMVLVLQIWEERSVKEIAELTGMSFKAVESLLTRARKKIKKMTEKYEGCF